MNQPTKKKRRKKHKQPRPVGPVAPALVPYARTLERAVGKPILGIKHSMTGDPGANFRAFVERKPADLSARSLGDWNDLQAAYMNVSAVDVKDIVNQIEAAGGDPLESPRTNAAAVNLFTASNLMHSAITLHLHPIRWNDRAACALLRVAFECAGRAALIANGTADEVHRWESAEEFRASDCVAALDKVIKKANPSCSDAKRVYSWLCNFGHMNYHGSLHFYLAQEGGNEDAFVALAIVAWAVAEVATFVIGTDLGATYPTKLPAKLPWD
jgi:hypothetical protein